MAKDKNIMRRGVNQALYKYLPESWVDFTQSGGGITYAVHVDHWNSIQLTGINNKRLLRIINQQVNEFKNSSSEGENAVVNFASTIDEENYYLHYLTVPRLLSLLGMINPDSPVCCSNY